MHIENVWKCKSPITPTKIASEELHWQIEAGWTNKQTNKRTDKRMESG
jgi:hypothetical protein